MSDQTVEGVAVTINGRSIEAQPGELVIDAAERNGVYIPRFCYHNRMRSVGKCRQCLVEIDTGRGPGLQPSCMVPVSDGMTVDTESELAKKAQDGILEFLLINHPLDCPICDKGGECPLQDQTMTFGPGESRFVEQKRNYEKPIPISDNVYLDRERCILCDRCTRFADEVAGDPLIHFMDRGNHTQVNTFPNEPFASYFSGNVVQICPVGALTAKPYRFKARPWDLEEVGSTSTVDSFGSRITVQSSRDEVLRFLGVDSEAVNWGWLSDKERFSFEAIGSEHRLSDPVMADGDDFALARWSDAVQATIGAIKATSPDRVAVLGGARLSTEDQYAWAKFAKGVIGTDHVDAQLGDGLPADFVLGAPRATVAEACAKGGVIVLMGPDPKESIAGLYLRLRHAVLNDGATLIEVGSAPSGLSKLAKHSLLGHAGDVPAIAAQLVADDPTGVAGLPAEAIAAAGAALRSGAPVTLLVGRTSVSEQPERIVSAATTILEAVDSAKVLPLLPRGNVFGALDMGLTPGLLPGRVDMEAGRTWFEDAWGRIPVRKGRDATAILESASLGDVDVLILLGSDPVTDFPDPSLVESALDRVPLVVSVDQFLNESSARADIVFPAAGAAESEGTFTNLEGRLSPLKQKVTPPGTARSDWMIASELASAFGADLGFGSVDEIRAEIEAVAPSHTGIDDEAIAGDVDGVVVPLPDADRKGRPALVALVPAATDLPAPTMPPSGTLRLTVTGRLFDAGVLVQQSPALAGLTPNTTARINSADLADLGIEHGARVEVSSGAGSIECEAEADDRMPRGGVAIPAKLLDCTALALLDRRQPLTDVTIRAVVGQ